MSTTRVSADIEITYETFGSPSDPVILLIAGLGAQLLSWEEGLCHMIAAEGNHVIRFDNRDCGLSTKIDKTAVDLQALIAAASVGDIEQVHSLAPYTLSHMAMDAVGLLESLGIARAHLVGASMGGMVAQLVASLYPERTASLVSMMSSTGEPGYGESTPEAQDALFGKPAESKQDYVTASITNAQVWGSRRHFDADAARSSASKSYDRCHCPEGVSRQIAALLATGSTANELLTLHTPTLVIHGLDDTLVAPSGGERTAELISGSELLLVEDMGHDRPEPLWPLLANAITTQVSWEPAQRSQPKKD